MSKNEAILTILVPSLSFTPECFKSSVLLVCILICVSQPVGKSLLGNDLHVDLRSRNIFFLPKNQRCLYLGGMNISSLPPLFFRAPGTHKMLQRLGEESIWVVTGIPKNIPKFADSLAGPIGLTI